MRKGSMRKRASVPAGDDLVPPSFLNAKKNGERCQEVGAPGPSRFQVELDGLVSQRCVMARPGVVDQQARGIHRIRGMAGVDRREPVLATPREGIDELVLEVLENIGLLDIGRDGDQNRAPFLILSRPNLRHRGHRFFLNLENLAVRSEGLGWIVTIDAKASRPGFGQLQAEIIRVRGNDETIRAKGTDRVSAPTRFTEFRDTVTQVQGVFAVAFRPSLRRATVGGQTIETGLELSHDPTDPKWLSFPGLNDFEGRCGVDQPASVFPEPQVRQVPARGFQDHPPSFGYLEPVRYLFEVIERVTNGLELDEHRRAPVVSLGKRLDRELGLTGPLLMGVGDDFVLAPI